MPLANVVDERKKPYRFLKVNAIVEAAWHDNSCGDSDQVVKPAEGEDDGPDYEEREHVTVQEAFQWADSFPQLVTLYLYDWDDGIYVTDPNYKGTDRRPPAVASEDLKDIEDAGC